jgi:hypothetical protein
MDIENLDELVELKLQLSQIKNPTIEDNLGILDHIRSKISLNDNYANSVLFLQTDAIYNIINILDKRIKHYEDTYYRNIRESLKGLLIGSFISLIICIYYCWDVLYFGKPK